MDSYPKLTAGGERALPNRATSLDYTNIAKLSEVVRVLSGRSKRPALTHAGQITNGIRTIFTRI